MLFEIVCGLILLAVSLFFVLRGKDAIRELNFLFSNQVGSFSIPENFVEGFSETIYMLSQQKEARLFGRSRVEDQSAETDSYERISPSEANDVTDRHGDTPLNNVIHSRRQVALQDADWAELIDKNDDIRLLIDPSNAYTMQAIAAMNRKKDDVFIAAALGTARAGKTGSLSVALPNSRKIVAVNSDKSSGSAPFSLYTLIVMNKKFDDEDIDEDEERYFAWSSGVKAQLLEEEKATSADYAAIKALVAGDIDTFMGFKFIRSQRLPLTTAGTDYSVVDGTVGSGSTLSAGARRCFAWVGSGMLSAIGIDLEVDVGIRRDKRMSKQIYVCHSVGAVRMEEEKVLEVIVDESAT